MGIHDRRSGHQLLRSVVKGTCCSFLMPWEDIIRDLTANYNYQDLVEVPRQQECIKYLLRVRMKVCSLDFKKHLRQVHVRPYVLVKLLDYLIDQGHEVFRGKGSAALLKERMRAAVAREYPNPPMRCLRMMASSRNPWPSSWRRLRRSVAPRWRPRA